MRGSRSPMRWSRPSSAWGRLAERLPFRRLRSRLARPLAVALVVELVVVVLIVAGLSDVETSVPGAGHAAAAAAAVTPLAGDGDGEDNGDDGDGEKDKNDSGEKKSADEDSAKGTGKDAKNDDAKKNEQQKNAEDDEQFKGRDEIGQASDNEFIAASQIESNSGVGEGGDFSRGSYTIQCSLTGNRNPDNPLLNPGVRNGAQHLHDYAGNESANATSDTESLSAATSTCTNGDLSPLFWPVLRNTNGVGPDQGQDGGSLDGNVGSLINPTSLDITFHGHGDEPVQAMPLNIALATGSAKSGTDNGKGANAKYACSGAEDRVTDLYPICPAGSELQRIYDFPSCWDGQNLESEKQNTHIVFPDKSGNCSSDTVPVPALRLTVSYADMPSGRQFAIDSFPEQQHNPITDHALMEYISTERRAEAGAECINSGQRCLQGKAQNLAFSTDPRDQLPPSMTYMHGMASMSLSRTETADQDLTWTRMISVLLPGAGILVAVAGRRGLLLALRRRRRRGAASSVTPVDLVDPVGEELQTEPADAGAVQAVGS